MMDYILYILVRLPLAIFPSLFIMYYAYKYKRETRDYIKKKENVIHQISKFHYLVFLTFSGAFVALALLLSTAWVKGDDWAFLYFGELDIRERLYIACGRYLRWVSRGGEFFGTIIGLSYNRWENWLFTSLLTAFAPFAFYSFVKIKNTTIFSYRGLFFYVIILCLCLLGVKLSVWRNYWCYAASVNYLFPTILMMWYLAYYRNDIDDDKTSVAKCAFLFVLGLLCGWGTECATAVILPLLTCWILYNLFRKNVLPIHSYWGYVGFIWGSFALFASPALVRRGRIVADSLNSYLSGMKPEEMDNFLNTLDKVSIESLRGASDIISLKDIPFFDHIYFVPYTTELFISCSGIVMVVFLILFVSLLCQRRDDKLRIILSSVFFLIVTWLCAFSYLVQCIPTEMSFLPACFIGIAGCGYILVRLRSKWVNVILLVVLFMTACIIFVPAGLEAMRYKKYETLRHEKILSLKNSGINDIVLERPYSLDPEDSISLIKWSDIKENPHSFPNNRVAQYYQINSISQKE